MHFLVKHTILAGFRDFGFGNLFVAIEVGASASHAQNAVVGASGEVLSIERHVQELSCGIRKCAEMIKGSACDVGIAPDASPLETLPLNGTGGQDLLAEFGRGRS